MKTRFALVLVGVKRIKRCGLTIRSTGPIAAGQHLGYKSLAQLPARLNRPVSSNVRFHRHCKCCTPKETTTRQNVALPRLQRNVFIIEMTNQFQSLLFYHMKLSEIWHTQEIAGARLSEQTNHRQEASVDNKNN